MSKFKVGDKVKIVNPVDDEYMKLIGYEFIVDKIDVEDFIYNYSDDNIGICWEPEELELVEESHVDGVWEINDVKCGLELKVNGFTIDPDIKVGNNLIARGYDGFIGITPIHNDEEKGEKDMNKVLELYKNRKIEELNDKLNEKMDEDYEKIEVIKEYNKLVEKFEKDLEDLFKNVENFDNDYLVSNYTDNLYKYKINEDKIKDELREKYQDEYDESRKELDKLIEEVDAQLSMSDDLGYQINVLTRYEILDKKDEKLKG